jgi:hypothetical protein
VAQLHKKFTDGQVKEILERYVQKRIERKKVKVIHALSPKPEARWNDPMAGCRTD